MLTSRIANMDADANEQTVRRELKQRETRLTGLPYWYQIHLHMPCNQRCIMCVPDGRHSSASLPLADFHRIFDQIKNTAKHLTLIGGETLLYPQIGEVLDFLAREPIGVTIITNATMLDEDICRRLGRLHELELKCSIDAATKETYRSIRGTDVFDEVWENLGRFARCARNRPHLKQILVYVVMRRNLHEVLDFIDLAQTLRPYGICYQPVKHVKDWIVDNRTGWTFDGREQSCESFKDEYNSVMDLAMQKAENLGLRCKALRV